MNTYITLNNYTVEYPDPPPAVAAHLDRIRAAVEDPKATVDDMLSLVYGASNPLMDLDFFPGRAMVTPAVMANPVFRVMSDLIGVKEVRLGLIDLEKAHAKYTLDVPTVAADLGLTQQAVRAAIDSGRLSALYRKGQWWVRPEAVASFKVSKAGRPKKVPTAPAPMPVATVVGRVGGTKGASLSVRIEGGEATVAGKDGQATLIEFPAEWVRAVVRTTTPTGTRAFVIEPADDAGEVLHEGLYVRGPFRIAKTVNNSVEAGKMWRAAGKSAEVAA